MKLGAEMHGTHQATLICRLPQLRENYIISWDVCLPKPKLISPRVAMLVEIELKRERAGLSAPLHL